MRTITSGAFTARSSSQPRPQRSIVPGRKFSATMSAEALSRLMSAWPSGSRRLHVIDFLLRDSTSHQYDSPARAGVPRRRRSSPRPGCSTLMTSAPNSPSSVQQKGAATKVARSSTVRPASAEGVMESHAVPRRPASQGADGRRGPRAIFPLTEVAAMLVPLTLGDFLERAETVYGDREAVVDEPNPPGGGLGRVGYAQLAGMARSMAAALDDL